jgi:terminase large subunit-like protein
MFLTQRSAWPSLTSSPRLSTVIDGARRRVEQSSRASDGVHSPVALMEGAGLRPDPWQRRLLESDAARILLLCSRQSGKSMATAAIVLAEVLFVPESLILVVCPAERQSKEFLADKVLRLYNANARPLDGGSESTLHLTLGNGSRILALPGNEATLRGYSGARLIVLDEAARVPDDLYYSLRPMLAVSGGRLIALTTPWGKRGWFHAEYTEGGADWERVKVTAHECPRITPEFLEEERRRLPDLWYKSEYLCQFEDVAGSVFSYEHIAGALSDEVQPLFAPVVVDEGETCQPLFAG